MRPSIVMAVGFAALLIDLGARSQINSAASVAATAVIALLILSFPMRRKPSVFAALGLSLAAVSVAMLRASSWVVVPALLVTFGGLVAASQDLFARPRWSLAVTNYLADMAIAIESAFNHVLRRRSATAAKPPLVRAFVLATVVVVPLGLLLASADAAFKGLLLGTADGQFWSHVVLIVLMMPPVAAAVVSARATDQARFAPGTGRHTLSTLEGSVVLGAVIALLTVWGATQVVVAVGGAERLLETANLTAAENARGGFFQLVAATAILTLVIIAADRLIERSTAADRMRFLGLTAVIAVETLGLVYASYSRLALYISGFGTTMLRLSVGWFLGLLAAVMVTLVISINVVSINGSLSNRGHTGSIIFVLTGLWVIAFGLSNPEASVASTNLDRQQTSVELDARYLGDALGADATPILVDRLAGVDTGTRQRLTWALCERAAADVGSGYGWLSWNWSHAEAEAAIATLDCQKP